MSRIRIAIVDSHTLLRETLSASLGGQHDMEVAWGTDSSQSAREMLLANEPDVLILDVEAHIGDAFLLLRENASAGRQVRVIALSSRDCSALIKQVEALGVNGHIRKADGLGAVLQEIREVARRQDSSSGRGGVRLRIDSSKHEDDLARPDQLQSLTPRQLEVFLQFARGASAKEVARRMHLSVTAVDNHKYRIMRRLGIHDRVELARLAIREGLISP